MRTLLLRTLKRLATRFFGLAMLGMALYMGYAVYSVISHEKSLLKRMARGIVNEVAPGEGVRTQPIAAGTAENLQQGLRILGDKEPLGVMVFRDGEAEPYWASNMPLALAQDYMELDAGDDSSLFLVSVKNDGNAWRDSLATWHLLYRLRLDGWCVMISAKRHFEFGERLVEAFVAGLVATVIFAGAGGYLYARRYLMPVNRLAQTMQQAENGEWSVRVDTRGFTDELLLVGTALNQMLERLEESFHKVADFSAGAAHELRTPLAALRGNMEVCLARDRDGDEYRETIGQTLEEVVRLAQIVEKLLLLARPGVLADAHLETLSLRQLVEEQLEKVQLLAEARRLRIECAWQTEKGVRGDSALLGQMVFNLLHNAAKHSPDDGIIFVCLTEADGTLLLTVTDQGAGVPIACRERIFQPFYQCEPSRGNGVGLGLALVRWIATAHGGRVEYTSAPDGGASFHLKLPIAKV